MERLINYVDHYYNSKLVNEDLSYDEKEELEYLENFLDEFDYEGDEERLYLVPNQHIVTAFLTSLDKNNIFTSIKSKINLLNLGTISSYSDIFRINELLLIFEKDEVFNIIKSLPLDFQENNLIVSELKEKGLYDDAVELYRLMKLIVGKSEESKNTFFELFEKYSIDFSLSLVAVALINDRKFTLHFSRNIINNDNNSRIMKYSFDMPDFDLEKETLVKSLEAIHIDKYYNSVIDKIDYLYALPNNRKKENNTLNKKKDKIISYLKKLDCKRPITLSKSFVESIQDERIKYFILKRIISINLGFQNKTKEDLKKEDLSSTLEKMFKKSCFSFDKLTDEEKYNLYTFGNIHDIEKILQLLTESDIKSYDKSFPIYDVLMLSKPSIVSDINKLVKSGFVSADFVINNPAIFVDKIDSSLHDKVNICDASYETFSKNINIFIASKIDTKLVSRFDSKILLNDPEFNLNILKLINLYELDYSKSNNYSLFLNPNLILIVDRFIELGLGEYIRNHTYLINEKSYIYLDRLEICKLLGLPLIVDGKLNPKVTQKEFRIGKNIISNEDIKNYIPNSVNRYFDDKMFSILCSNNKVVPVDGCLPNINEYDNFTIKFGDVIISKLKVLRNYSLLRENNCDQEKALFHAIIYGSVLDDEQLDIISNSLENINLEYKKMLE